MKTKLEGSTAEAGHVNTCSLKDSMNSLCRHAVSPTVSASGCHLCPEVDVAVLCSPQMPRNLPEM